MARDTKNLLQLLPKVLFQRRAKQTSQGAGLFRADNTLFRSIGHVLMLKLK